MLDGHGRLVRAAVAVLVAVAVSGCSVPGAGSGGGGSSSKRTTTTPSTAVGGGNSLVVNGMAVAPNGTRSGTRVPPGADGADGPTPRAVAAAKRRSTPAVKRAVVWPAPDLAADGTIEDGADPFGPNVQVRPLPVEDDPSTTEQIDVWSKDVKAYDSEDWRRWLQRGATVATSAELGGPAGSVVSVAVERCGGAQVVSSGVVVGAETVVTSAHVVADAQRRVRVAPALAVGGVKPRRIPAMVRYLDVDDDIAVLKVPGLTSTPIGTLPPRGASPVRSYVYGISTGSPGGTIKRVPAYVASKETSITLEQPDGFGQRIRDRSVFPLSGGVDTGFSGAPVVTTDDPDLKSGWGLHGIVRARVPFRSEAGGIVVPARLVTIAVAAAARLDTWFEIRPGACPKWAR